MPEKTRNEKRDKKMERMARYLPPLRLYPMKLVWRFLRISVLANVKAILNKDNRPSVCSVASNFNISLSTISHHMKELRNAGLIRCERKGQTIL